MITLNDVDYLIVDSSCEERYPCGHDCKITLKDGRSSSNLDSYQICSLISRLADEKINPGMEWKPDGVKRHFQEYNQSNPSMGWNAESAEVVLNKLFPSTLKLSFDMNQMLVKAEQFSKGNDQMLNYIVNILNKPQFQDDPKQYLSNWRDRRGYTEEFRWPEDRARGFFENNF